MQQRYAAQAAPQPQASTSGRFQQCGRTPLRPFRRSRSVVAKASSQQQQPPSPGDDAGAWWASLNKRAVRGPDPPAVDPEPRTPEEWNESRMGVKGYRDFETTKRDERQRVWDSMRRIARQRYQRGEMPGWFKPAWLDVEEAPTNTFWRAQGMRYYQQDPRWLGDSAPSDGGDDGGSSNGGGDGDGRGGSGGGGSWRWWREEDPYWPLRDWGDHPMRWWTLGFAALLAAGGLAASVAHGSVEAAQVGLGAGAVLAVCAGAMSDMQDAAAGHLAVKIAWATCASLAAYEYFRGWRHKRTRRMRVPHLEGCGFAAVAMCALYMLTGMSGLSQYALPTNPGEAFKMADVAQKSKIWTRWGYGNVEMRG